MAQTGEQLAIGGDLSRWLLEEHVLSLEQLAEATRRQGETGAPLGVTLVELKYLAEDDLVDLVARRHGVPRAPERLYRQQITVKVLSRIPQDLCWQYGVFPFAVDRQTNRVQVAIVDPGDAEALETLVELTGGAFDLHVAGPQALEKAIRKHYLDAWVDDSQRNEKKRGLRFFGYDGITNPGTGEAADLVRHAVEGSGVAGPAPPPEPHSVRQPPTGDRNRDPSGSLRIARLRPVPELGEGPAASAAPGLPTPPPTAAFKLGAIVPIDERLRRLEQAVHLLLRLTLEHAASPELREEARRVSDLLES